VSGYHGDSLDTILAGFKATPLARSQIRPKLGPSGIDVIAAHDSSRNNTREAIVDTRRGVDDRFASAC